MLWAELEDNPKPTVAELEAIFRRHANAKAFSATITEAAVSGVGALSRNGSWLFKRWVKNGNRPAPEVVEMIVDNLDNVRGWDAMLLFCQVFSAAPEIMANHGDEFAAFLRRCADHKTPIVRAWAISAFAGLAGVAPAFKREAALMVARGRADPAPSVKARMRHVADPDSAG